MTKMVPSPDWFIGLDSLDLCSQGSFIESVITEVKTLKIKILSMINVNKKNLDPDLIIVIL